MEKEISKEKISEVKRTIEIEDLKLEVEKLKRSRFYLFGLNIVIMFFAFLIFYDTYIRPSFKLLQKLAKSYWGWSS